MPDIRVAPSVPFSVIAGLGFGGAGGVDSFITIIGSPETTRAHVSPANPLTGRLFSVVCTNNTAAPIFLQVWAGATPNGLVAPFPTRPAIEFTIPVITTQSPTVYGRDFFGMNGLEFVTASAQNAGYRLKMPVSEYMQLAPNVCGVCVAVSQSSGTYLAVAAPNLIDLQGTFGT